MIDPTLIANLAAQYGPARKRRMMPPELEAAEQEYLRLSREGPQVMPRGKLQKVLDAIVAGGTSYLEGPTRGFQVASALKNEPYERANLTFQQRMRALGPQVERADYWRKQMREEADDLRKDEELDIKRTESSNKNAYYTSRVEQDAENERGRNARAAAQLEAAAKNKKLSVVEIERQWYERDPEAFEAFKKAQRGYAEKSDAERRADIAEFAAKERIRHEYAMKERKTPAEIEAEAAARARGASSVPGPEFKYDQQLPHPLALQFMRDPTLKEFIVATPNEATGTIRYTVRPLTDKEQTDPNYKARYDKLMSELNNLTRARGSLRFIEEE